MTTTTAAPSPEVLEGDGGLGGAFRAYVERLRGGEVGSLPAVTGLVVLFAFFAIAQPDKFATNRNLANLLVQGAPVIFIAMGLVFILLLGEIDLGAGFTAGTGAAVVAVLVTNHGVAWPIAVVACIVTGVVIGAILGALVALLRIPSFVVTLASFLALQGVLLAVIGQGGTIPVNQTTILALMNNNMPPWLGWVMFLVIVGGYAGLNLLSTVRRRRAGLAVPSTAVLAFKIIALAVILAIVTFFLNEERAVNPGIKSLKGVPIIVPIAVVFLLVLTFVLNRTSFGRHIYAVGGNAEAARRAGIGVSGIRISCFVISSVLATLAGVLFDSYNNSVSPSTGGTTTLLYAVAAAVIGGTSLFGGKGRVVDAILGGLVVAIIQNGLPFITTAAAPQYIVTGAVLLLAASVDAISRRRAAATGR